MKNTTVNELKQTIKKIYSLSEQGKYISLMIWGPPGVGKSAGVRQATEEMEIGFIDLRLSLLNPVDLRGLPSVDKEKKLAQWLVPDFLPHGDKGILFLDEINLAPQSVMAAAYQLILDRKLGDYVVPDGWIIVAAGNRSEDTPNVTKMPPPLANRFVHMQITAPDDAEWRQWAINHGVAEQIVAFISKMPQHLFVVPKITDKAWPSPRSWELASNLLMVGEDVDAAVGGGVGVEFRAFLNVYSKIPDIDAILNGEKVDIPKANEVDIIWATCMSLLYRAKCNEKTWSNVFKFLEQLPKEFEVLMLQLFYNKSAEWKKVVAYSKEAKEFIKKNPDLLGE